MRPRIHMSIMLDTKGPEIRTGFLKEGVKHLHIRKGDEVEISNIRVFIFYFYSY